MPLLYQDSVYTMYLAVVSIDFDYTVHACMVIAEVLSVLIYS